MSQKKRNQEQPREPQGFTPRTSGLSSEYAREQGWNTNEEQRSRTPREKQPYDGSRSADYGARDSGAATENANSADRDEDEHPPDPQGD